MEGIKYTLGDINLDTLAYRRQVDTALPHMNTPPPPPTPHDDQTTIFGQPPGSLMTHFILAVKRGRDVLLSDVVAQVALIMPQASPYFMYLMIFDLNPLVTFDL